MLVILRDVEKTGAYHVCQVSRDSSRVGHQSHLQQDTRRHERRGSRTVMNLRTETSTAQFYGHAYLW